MYVVINAFYDLKDDARFYRVGDVFPREGFTVTEERIKELSGDKNRVGHALIAEQKAPEKTPEKTVRKRTAKK